MRRMFLYLMDDETENPIAGRVRVDFDYIAEQWVQDVASGRSDQKSPRPLVTFILCDDDGVRCVWTRSVEEAGNKALPKITKITVRFSGEWKHDLCPAERLDPQDDYERRAMEHFHQSF